jgi:hypothetical protein
MDFNSIGAAANRQRNIRIILFVIILMTTPFYCVGFFLWGTAKPSGLLSTPTVAFTNTPIGQGLMTATSAFPSVTPFGLTPSLLSPLQPTPLQFIPIPHQPTVFIPPTATPYLVPIIPTDTLAPTLTLIPSSTPLPTDVPPPSFTPPPTFTLTPTNTDVPVVVPPTDTPLPFDDTTVEPPPP